jgi:hypothetical protein
VTKGVADQRPVNCSFEPEQCVISCIAVILNRGTAVEAREGRKRRQRKS